MQHSTPVGAVLDILGSEVSRPEDQLASERLALLVEASGISTSRIDVEGATRAILRRAVPVLADCCFFDVIAPDGHVVRSWSTRGGGVPPAGRPSLLPWQDATEHPRTMAARTGTTQVRAPISRTRPEPHRLPPLLREPTSLVSVPLAGDDENNVSVLTFCFAESGRQHSADDILVAEEVGRRISAAMENARLRGRAREVVGTILRERERFDALLRSQEVLVEAGTLLASSVDYTATLRRIVELTVPRLADYCFIHIPDADGRLRRVAERYDTPNPLAEFKAPLKLPPASPIMRVLRTGASVWLKEVTDDDLVSWSQSDEHLVALRGSRPRSLVAVPLIAHGRLLGTMVFAFNTSERIYDEEAVSLVEQLAQRAAWALDTALLREAADGSRREAAEARREADEARASKDMLLELFAQKLGLPRAALRLLEAARDDEARATTLHLVRGSATAQRRLLDDLLDVSACAIGALEIDRGPMDLGALVADSVARARLCAPERTVTYEARPGEPPVTILGDAFRLREVVGILLSNALALTGPGGTIRVSVRRCEEGVDVVVTDDGRGISSDALPHVFDPFGRDWLMPPEDGGLGLSLALAQQLVHMHGGTIRATSPGPGAGSTFTMTLPVVP
jgi:signal transduction histidine kinase